MHGAPVSTESWPLHVHLEGRFYVYALRCHVCVFARQHYGQV